MKEFFEIYSLLAIHITVITHTPLPIFSCHSREKIINER